MRLHKQTHTEFQKASGQLVCVGKLDAPRFELADFPAAPSDIEAFFCYHVVLQKRPHAANGGTEQLADFRIDLGQTTDRSCFLHPNGERLRHIAGAIPILCRGVGF